MCMRLGVATKTMAFSLISSVATGSPTGDTFTSDAMDSTGADFLVVFISSYAQSSIPVLTDSKSNSFTGLTQQAVSLGPVVRLFYVAGPTVGSGHTFTLTALDRYASVGALAFSGSFAATPFDVQNGANGTVATLQPGSVSPSEDNELIVCGLGVEPGAGVETIDGSFTKLLDIDMVGGNHFGLCLAYKIQTTAGAENPTWTIGATIRAASVIATFKAAAGGGGILPQAAYYSRLLKG